MNNGWVSLHRSILDWEWYEDANTVRLFIHCLLKANYEPKVWRNIAIDKGQFYTSLDSLSSELGLSTKQIRVSLDKLKRTGSVASSQHARGRMITVAKYEEYQEEGRLNDSQKAGSGQAEGRVGAATNNYNNNNKVITNTPDKPKYEDCDYEFAKSAFEEIQKVNPNHKKPNLKNWAIDVRKMREIDNRIISEMETVWLWIRQDQFWSTNCLSISKFREKYDQLQMKSIGVNTNGTNQGSTTTRPDNSAAGRVRQNVAEGIAAKRAEIDQIRRDRPTLATDVIDVRTQMDERLR